MGRGVSEISGILNIFTGEDTIGSVVINGVDVTTGGTVITDFGVLTVSVDADGNYSYSYRLTAAIDHPDNPDFGSNEGRSDDFTVVVTDGDGDTASDDFVIGILDDGPFAFDDAFMQSSENTDVTGNLLAGNGSEVDVFGADGQGNVAVVLVDGSLMGDGELTVNADGTFTYTPGTAEAGVVTFEYTITDADGDTSTATATITLAADSTPTAGTATAAVDDDGLLGGNDLTGPENGDAVFSGVLGGSLGGDGAGANGFSFDGSLEGTTAMIGLEMVTYSVSADGLTVTATITGGDRDGTALFTAEITDAARGEFTVTQLDNVLHAGGPNDEGLEALAALSYIITDADGTAVTGSSLTITFDDDAPSAVADGVTQAVEDTPVDIDVFANDAQGADGVDLATGVAVVADSLSGTGTLVYNADGTFTYTPGTAEAGVVTFEYTITDADGDTSTALATITLAADSTPTVGTATAAVDDDGLLGGNDLTGPENGDAVFSGVLGGSLGGDGAGDNGFSFDASLEGTTAMIGLEMVTYSVSADGLTVTATITGGDRDGTALFTAQITDAATGEFTVTQLDNVLHAGGPNDEGIDAICLLYTSPSPRDS